MGLTCCCKKDNAFIDNNFKTTVEKLEKGPYKTTVVNKKGDSLHLFCDYGILNLFSELSTVHHELAIKIYHNLNNEITRMIEYLEKRGLLLNNMTFYKVDFVGNFEEKLDPNKVNNLEVIEFHLNADCKNNEKKQCLMYRYNWRKDGRLGFNPPQQTLELVDFTK